MISLGVIVKELLCSGEYEVISSNLAQIGDIKIYGVSPLHLTKTFHPQWLYLADETTDLSRLDLQNTDAVLFLGDTVPSLPKRIGLVVCRGVCGRESADLYDFLVGIIAKYQTWVEGLEACIRTEDAQKMLDLSYPMFRSTLSLFDADLNWLGISGPEYQFYLDNDNQLPVDFIHAVKDDEHGREVHRRRGAFVAPDPMGYFNTQALCYNLFLHDQYWGRIVVMDQAEKKEFLPGDFYLLNVLGEKMQTLLRQQSDGAWSAQNYNASMFSRLLYRFLNREPITPNELRHGLTTCGWNPEEKFYIGYLYLNQNDISVGASSFYCRYIMQEDPNVVAMEWEQNILLMIPQSRYPQITDFMSGFVLVLRENNFRLGISNLCGDLSELYYYYLQAKAAFSVGSQRKNYHWYHIFADYTLDYLLQTTRDLPSRYFCSEKLMQLVAYDQENDTEYVKTLQTYIHNQMNAVQTAKELYIHHATMVFRLKRLKEIVDINFKDMEQITQLYLSLRILEMENTGELTANHR